jgi:hypothetical protein
MASHVSAKPHHPRPFPSPPFSGRLDLGLHQRGIPAAAKRKEVAAAAAVAVTSLRDALAAALHSARREFAIAAAATAAASASASAIAAAVATTAVAATIASAATLSGAGTSRTHRLVQRRRVVPPVLHAVELHRR